MKICIFSESFEPILNGVAVSIGILLKGLRENGNEAYVVTSSYRGHNDADSHVFRVPAIHTWIDPSYPIPIPWFSQIHKKLRELKPDIIHTHTPWLLGQIGLKLAKRMQIPCVSTCHTQYTEYTHYFPFAPQIVKRLFIINLMRRYYNQCDGVIVPSKLMMEMLQGFGVRAPMYVIPTANDLNTVMDPNARAQIRQKAGIPESARVLLYVGRLAKEKNLNLIFEAFEKLAQKHGDLYLLIVGGGPYESTAKQIASSLKSLNRIVFAGAKPRSEVTKYYSAGDIFVFPSMTETQGLVLCEAMAAGLPCVAVRAGGSTEMINEGEDGLLAENDVDDFAAKIELLLTDKEMHSRFSESAVRNSALFTPAEMTAKVLAVYKSVLS